MCRLPIVMKKHPMRWGDEVRYQPFEDLRIAAQRDAGHGVIVFCEYGCRSVLKGIRQIVRSR